ncbi:WD repeat-containing protein YMR102C-like [Apium graveolens]|uniref:WD repeat-containing protein YMR102C-like n=1 Tax=Apium graveolens TaxID=4045 RepID=UPI003D7B565E
MPSLDANEEVFFESADYLSSEESVVENEDLSPLELGYEVWMCEPRSVNERRERFMTEMGLLESSASPESGSDRVRDCSGAVSSSCALSFRSVEDSMVCVERDSSRKGNCMVDELDHDQMESSISPDWENVKVSISAEHTGHSPPQTHLCENEEFLVDQRRARSLWKSLKSKFKRNLGPDVKSVMGRAKSGRLKVQKNNKKCREMSAVYVGQEFHAHEGLIWTMKFSPDGQYLASGGEDGVVRIWHVTTTCTSCKKLCIDKGRNGISGSGSKKLSLTSVVIPDTDFQMEELPLQELHGHTSDVLDLAWSNSNCLLSSSKDKTVRLWKVGHDKCLGVFNHKNYVTCTQFNPVDENYFISGSIDGKVRIWGVNEKRVVDWADVRDVITATCYHPNGNNFAVGSLSGTCRFYDASGNDLLLAAEFQVQGKKRFSGNRITGIEFTEKDSQKVMITSEDSKIRIFDGIDIIHKYRGLSNSRSQMSASFTSSGKHIISVGEDSHIYVWNYDDEHVPSKHPRSVRSCEHFLCEGVSVAVPWSNRDNNQKACACRECAMPKQDIQDSTKCIRDSERFSLANWFYMDGSFRGTATWPEERLPLWDVPEPEHNHKLYDNDQAFQTNHCSFSHDTWGLVIVTAGSDGMIRTFHNYGLPVKN